MYTIDLRGQQYRGLELFPHCKPDVTPALFDGHIEVQADDDFKTASIRMNYSIEKLTLDTCTELIDTLKYAHFIASHPALLKPDASLPNVDDFLSIDERNARLLDYFVDEYGLPEDVS